jgi:hypothetical protein
MLGYRSRGSWMLGKVGFVAIVLVSAGVATHPLNPRELYNEMYPVETLKRDAFHICNDADPTFVRAVKVDREACYDSMPHAIELALGRIHANGALTMADLLDPLHQAELIKIVSTPPRQPITAPRSFANTEWARSLSPPCAGGVAQAQPAAVALNTPGLPPGGVGRAAAPNSAIAGNLPPLAHAGQTGVARQAPPPVIPLTASAPKAANPATGAQSFNPLPSPDVGDSSPPAIVPLASGGNCGGA